MDLYKDKYKKYKNKYCDLKNIQVGGDNNTTVNISDTIGIVNMNSWLGNTYFTHISRKLNNMFKYISTDTTTNPGHLDIEFLNDFKKDVRYCGNINYDDVNMQLTLSDNSILKNTRQNIINIRPDGNKTIIGFVQHNNNGRNFVLKKFPTNYQTVQVYSPINIITNTRNNMNQVDNLYNTLHPRNARIGNNFINMDLVGMHDIIFNLIDLDLPHTYFYRYLPKPKLTPGLTPTPAPAPPPAPPPTPAPAPSPPPESVSDGDLDNNFEDIAHVSNDSLLDSRIYLNTENDEFYNDIIVYLCIFNILLQSKYKQVMDLAPCVQYYDFFYGYESSVWRKSYVGCILMDSYNGTCKDLLQIIFTLAGDSFVDPVYNEFISDSVYDIIGDYFDRDASIPINKIITDGIFFLNKSTPVAITPLDFVSLHLHDIISQIFDILLILKQSCYLFFHSDLKLENVYYKTQILNISDLTILKEITFNNVKYAVFKHKRIENDIARFGVLQGEHIHYNSVHLADFDKSSITYRNIRFRPLRRVPYAQIAAGVVISDIDATTVSMDMYNNLKQSSEHYTIPNNHNYINTIAATAKVQVPEFEQSFMRYSIFPFFMEFDFQSFLTSLVLFMVKAPGSNVFMQHSRNYFSIIGTNNYNKSMFNHSFITARIIYIYYNYLTKYEPSLIKDLIDCDAKNYNGNFGKMIQPLYGKNLPKFDVIKRVHITNIVPTLFITNYDNKIAISHAINVDANDNKSRGFSMLSSKYINKTYNSNGKIYNDIIDYTGYHLTNITDTIIKTNRYRYVNYLNEYSKIKQDLVSSYNIIWNNIKDFITTAKCKADCSDIECVECPKCRAISSPTISIPNCIIEHDVSSAEFEGEGFATLLPRIRDTLRAESAGAGSGAGSAGSGAGAAGSGAGSGAGSAATGVGAGTGATAETKETKETKVIKGGGINQKKRYILTRQ